MKQFLSGFPLVFLFLAMMFSPKEVFLGAQNGLLLWFQVVFPTLFPFMLVSGLMLTGGGLDLISHILGKLFSVIFSTSPNGAFAVIAGFLFGYPMGAKVTADLVRNNKITRAEAAYLLSFCNNTSPIFIMNFIVWKTLKNESLLIPTLLILIMVPILLSLLFRRFYLKGKKCFPCISQKIKSDGKSLDFSILLDSCLSDSFECIVKVGLYIIFFSILISLFERMTTGCPVLWMFVPILEMTNGILIIHSSIQNLTLSYPIILAIASFGGICAVFQTQCMLKGSGLSIFAYITQKLTAAAAASLFGIIYMQIF